MLCLTRRRGESVVLDTPAGRIVVSVLEVDHGKVQLGFTAAADVRISRDELLSDVERAPVKLLVRGTP